MSNHPLSGRPLASHSGPLRIAVDAMGGDYGPSVVIPGAALALSDMPELTFLFYGDQGQIAALLEQHPPLKARSTVHHTHSFVRNDEKPSAAVRAGKDTSMRLAIDCVAAGRAEAVVSAGNTGALMALAKLVFKTLPGIHRPAIASVFPTLEGSTIMLDLGANVLVDAESLVQFAVLGAVFARAQKGVPVPTIGLLNVGTEDTKGPDHVRSAASILSQVEIPGRYVGFVEGNDITKGTVDVVVSDGYAGNIALKTAEGLGAMVGQYFKKTLMQDPLSMIGGFLAFGAIRRFKKKVDPRLYNGGVLLGLNGLCIKSHGGTDALGFSSAVKLAATLARHHYTDEVTRDLHALMSQDSVLAHGSYEG